MTVANYGELQTYILNQLGGNIATDRIVEAIEIAEQHIDHEIMRRGGLRAWEAANDLMIDAQQEVLPARFLGVRRLYLSLSDRNRVLQYLAPQDFWNRYLSTQTGEPEAYTIEGENFEFGPAPDSTYTGKLLYWRYFTRLALAGDTDWRFTNANGLLIFGSLINASRSAHRSFTRLPEPVRVGVSIGVRHETTALQAH